MAKLRLGAKRINTCIKDDRNLHVYFDNEAKGSTSHDILCLIRLVKENPLAIQHV